MSFLLYAQWMMYDLEVTRTDLHIYEGGNDTRKVSQFELCHLRQTISIPGHHHPQRPLELNY